MASLFITAAVGGSSVCEMDVNKNSLRTELCGETMQIVNGRVDLVQGAGLVNEPEAEQLVRFGFDS